MSQVPVTKGAPDGDARGVWRVHVQAGASQHGDSAVAAQLGSAQPAAASPLPAAHIPAPAPCPASKPDKSSPSFPKHFTLRTSACTPSPNTIVVSSAEATCCHQTVKTPMVKAAATDLQQQQSGSGMAAVTPPVTLHARSRSAQGLNADGTSKLPTQCSETSDSGSPPLPVVCSLWLAFAHTSRS